MALYHPFDDAVLDDPLPTYRRLRDEAPAYYLEEFDCWFLSRFEDIWRAEQDLKSFTVKGGVTSYQLLKTREEREAEMEAYSGGASLSALDPPEHTPARVLLAPSFKPAAARELEDFTRGLVKGFVDEFIENGQCDVIADLAMRTSVRIACKIAGIPLENADWLVEQVNGMFTREPGEGEISFVDPMHEFLLEFITRRRAQPGDAVVDVLIGAELGGKKLDDEAIMAHLSLLVVGGTETLPKVFASAIHRLWEHPDQRAELVADPELIPAAFDEVLRYDMPTQMLGRTVVRDIEFHGETFRPGQAVLFLFASANRDEREFPDADRFDIHRNAPRILTFGHGTHR